MIAARRSFLLGAGALGLAGPAWSREGLALDGRFVQGGFAMGRTWPRAIVFVDGEALTTASAAGLFIVGFDRDAAASARIEVLSGVRRESRDVTIAPGDFAITRIDGLPPQTVTPTAPEVLARIQREAALKTEASPAARTPIISTAASSVRWRPGGSPAAGAPSASSTARPPGPTTASTWARRPAQ
ncbi:hypothetical protein [Brevundimonas abyssalis]|uniref:hypothetical protein n=1 Tax=Brevundimonas abyssalis TaxID=1125965 RepID=UPI000422EE72|nr:hypothetical protein [Brevundimonas abyssalis]